MVIENIRLFFELLKCAWTNTESTIKVTNKIIQGIFSTRKIQRYTFKIKKRAFVTQKDYDSELKEECEKMKILQII